MEQANHYIIHTIQYDLVNGGSLVEVYERGQIVIPKHVRDMLKITPGTQLSVSVDGTKIVLEQYDAVKELEEIQAGASLSDGETEKAIKELRRKREKEWADVP